MEKTLFKKVKVLFNLFYYPQFILRLLHADFPLVHCETTKGPLTIEVHKDWSPLGAERFIDLVRDDFFTDIAFFRCVERFLTQFGFVHLFAFEFDRKYYL